MRAGGQLGAYEVIHDWEEGSNLKVVRATTLRSGQIPAGIVTMAAAIAEHANGPACVCVEVEVWPSTCGIVPANWDMSKPGLKPPKLPALVTLYGKTIDEVIQELRQAVLFPSWDQPQWGHINTDWFCPRKNANAERSRDLEAEAWGYVMPPIGKEPGEP